MSVTTDVLGAAAQAVSDAARSGQGMRASAKGMSYALVGNASIAARCTEVSIDGKTYGALRVTDSATPATVVAEGAPKPEAVETEPADVDLVKHAGFAKVSLETLTYYDEARRVIVDVLWKQCVRSFDSTIVAAMAANSDTVTTTATSKSGRLIDAFAHLIDNGANPSSIVLNPADWAAVVGANDGGSYLNMTSAEAGPASEFLGAALVPASTVPANTAYVFDQSAVVVAAHQDAPWLFLSPMDTSNMATLILDLLAAPLVVLPKGVAQVDLDLT